MTIDRPFYPHELNDPDLHWLLEVYRERNPKYSVVDSSGLPVLLVKSDVTDLTEHLETITTQPSNSAPPKNLPVPTTSIKGVSRS